VAFFSIYVSPSFGGTNNVDATTANQIGPATTGETRAANRETCPAAAGQAGATAGKTNAATAGEACPITADQARLV
jgi:hypothetical protein